MQKIFIYQQSMMNGTVTMSTEIGAFTSRELAEQTREAVRESNKDADLGGFRIYYGEVKEICVYDSIDEIPFFQDHKEFIPVSNDNNEK